MQIGERVFIGFQESVNYYLRGEQGMIVDRYTDGSAKVKFDYPVYLQDHEFYPPITETFIDEDYLVSLDE